MKLNAFFGEITSFKIYRTLFIISSIYFLKEILIVSEIEPIWKNFWDSNDYRLQSESDLFSLDFFSPKPRKWFSPRPFTIPLMYKLVDSDIYKFILFQKFFYSLSVIQLVLVINKFITNNFLKTMNALFLLFFFTWWNILGWSNNAVSESFSISFMLIWISSIILFYNCYSRTTVILLALTSILFSFTRDNWSYIILAFFILNLFLNFHLNKKKIVINLFFVVYFISIFLIQSYTMKIGERNVIPIFNSIAVRVSQNNEYLKWFADRGMPDKDLLEKNFKKIDVETLPGKTLIYRSYEDSSYKKLFKWIKENGKSAYQKFIISHPGYFFLKDQSKQQIDRIFCYNVSGYYQPARKFFSNAENTFPVFSNFLFFVLLSAGIYLYVITKDKNYLIAPILGFLIIINALIVYNADTLEVKRHLFITVVGREFLCIYSTALIIDHLIKMNKQLNWSNKIYRHFKISKKLNGKKFDPNND